MKYATLLFNLLVIVSLYFVFQQSRENKALILHNRDMLKTYIQEQKTAH